MATQTQVRKFLLEYCTNKEKKDYLNYISGDKTKDSWIIKASGQREKIIHGQPKCNKCESYINIYENGRCYCNNNHQGYEQIIQLIKQYKEYPEEKKEEYSNSSSEDEKNN